MKLLLSPKKALQLLQLGGVLTFIWPYNLQKKSHSSWHNMLWWLTVINFLFLIIPLIAATYHNKQNTVVWARLLLETTIVTEALLSIICYKLEEARFRDMILEVTAFIKAAGHFETEMMSQQFRKYFPYQMVLTVSFIIGVVIYLTGPFIKSNKEYALDTWYIVTIESTFVKFLIYLHQDYVILQIGVLFIGDFVICTLLWYAALKLEMLGRSFKFVQNNLHLRECIRGHQSIIQFVENLGCAAHLIVVKTIVFISIILICGSIQLFRIQDQADVMIVLTQFSVISLVAATRLFMCAWPATNLIQAGENLKWWITDSLWLYASRSRLKTVSIIIQRCHRPLVIPLQGKFVLSLECIYNSCPTFGQSEPSSIREIR